MVEACNRSITCIDLLSRQYHMIVKGETRHDTPIASRHRMFSINKDIFGINSARRNKSSHICYLQAKKSIASCSSTPKKLSREQKQDNMKCFIVLVVCLFVGASGEDCISFWMSFSKELCFMYCAGLITVKHSSRPI